MVTFCGLGVGVVKKSTAVVFVKDSGESPGAVVEGLDVLDFDKEDVAGFGAFDIEGSGEVVHAREVDVFDIVGGVVVLDLSACPVYAFDFDGFARFDGGD